MTERSRAWRRRNARRILAKVQETKEWLFSRFQDDSEKPTKKTKKHRPGKLTPIQDMRLNWSMNQDLADGA